MANASKGMDLKGKTAVVTGANSGIGLAVSTALAEAGCNLVISGRRESKNRAVAEELARKFNLQTLAVEADVSREADCVRLIQQAVAKFGTIHILVNNAGIGGGIRVAETKTEDFDRVLKTNLYGTFWCARAAYPQMKRNEGDPRGVIINISSLAGKQSNRRTSPRRCYIWCGFRPQRGPRKSCWSAGTLRNRGRFSSSASFSVL